MAPPSVVEFANGSSPLLSDFWSEQKLTDLSEANFFSNEAFLK
jgi:hypothetical protein